MAWYDSFYNTVTDAASSAYDATKSALSSAYNSTANYISGALGSNTTTVNNQTTQPYIGPYSSEYYAKLSSGGTTSPTTTSSGQYVKLASSNDVYDISSGTPRYVSYEEAVSKNIFPQIKTVSTIPGSATSNLGYNPFDVNTWQYAPKDDFLVPTSNVTGASKTPQSSFGGPGSTTGFMAPTAQQSGLPKYANNKQYTQAATSAPAPATYTPPLTPIGINPNSASYRGATYTPTYSTGSAQQGGIVYRQEFPQSPSGEFGLSPGQFGGTYGGSPTAISGHPGGAALLPGSTSYSFGRFAGGPQTLTVPNTTEQEKNKTQLVKNAGQSITGGNMFSSFWDRLFGTNNPPIGAAQASTTATGAVLGPSPLTTQQKGMVGATTVQPDSYSSNFLTATNSPITGLEYAQATTKVPAPVAVKPTDTISNFNKVIQDRVQGSLVTLNTQNQILKQQAEQQIQKAAYNTVASTTGGYFKSTNPQTGQIDVFALDPSGNVRHVTLNEFQQNGLNIDHIPDSAKFGNDLQSFVNENRAKIIDPVTEQPYVKEDFEISDKNPLKTELEAKQKEIDAAKTKYNLDIDIGEIRQKAALDADLPSLNAQKRALQDNINALTGEYEKLADEIRNDPNFSKRLKAGRMSFLDDQKQRALAGFQRQLGLLVDQIGQAENKAAQSVRDQLDTYTIHANQIKQLEADKEKIMARIERATDNDRQLLQFYANTYGGQLWNQIPQASRDEIASQFNNPAMVAVLRDALVATQKDKALQLQLQSVANRTPSGSTINIQGLTPTGGVQGTYAPKTKTTTTTGGGGRYGNYTFTKAQLEKGASYANVSLSDFMRFDPEAMNMFINGYTKQVSPIITMFTAALKKNPSQDVASYWEGQIAESQQLPEETKNYLTILLKQTQDSLEGQQQYINDNSDLLSGWTAPTGGSLNFSPK